MTTPTLPSAIAATINNSIRKHDKDEEAQQITSSSSTTIHKKIQSQNDDEIVDSFPSPEELKQNKKDDLHSPSQQEPDQQKDNSSTVTISSANKEEEEKKKEDENFMQNVLLPHLALVFVPFLASINTTLARASFILYDAEKGEEPLKPFTLAICRTIISTSIFYVLRSSSSINGWFSSSSSKTKSEKENQESKKIDQHHQEKESTVVPLQDPFKSTASVIDYLEIFSLGIVGISLNFIFFFRGIQLTNQVTAATFMALVPSIVFLLGYLTGNESFTLMKMISTIFLWAGNCFTAEVWRLFYSSSSSTANETNNITQNASSEERGVSSSSSTSFDSSFYLGIVYLILNQLCFSSYLVFQKPILNKKKFDFITFMFLMMVSGLAGLLFLSLIPRENEVTNNLFGGRLAPISYVAILYSGVIQSSVTYFLIAWGISKCKSPLLASLINNSQPVLVVLEAVMFLDETLNQNQIIGGVIIIAGVAISIYASIMSTSK